MYMPAGAAYTRREGGWSLHSDPIADEPIPPASFNSAVYGVDTHFTVPVTDTWAMRQLTPPKSDPRSSTRRVAQTKSNAHDNDRIFITPDAIDSRVDRRFALHDMSRDEIETANALINGVNGPDPRRLIRMSPAHNIDPMGEFSGYRFSAAAVDSCSALPINRTMFHGTSAVKCSTSLRGAGASNLDAVRLLADMSGCVETMRALMRDISFDATNAMRDKTMACFGCSPCSTGVTSTGKATGSTVHAGIDSVARARDSRAWVCDEPTTIGIYHAWVKRPDKPREHQLVIICTGGCRTACDEFMNITSELAVQCKKTTTGDICESEEVWWLRKLCSRMRNRLMLRTADAFGLTIPVMKDVHAFNPEQLMAVVHNETCAHDITNLRSGEVAVFNCCVDTTTPRSGVLCEMNPSEGFKLFHGPTANNGSEYGGVFGKQTHCGIFPTAANRLSADVQKSNTRPFVTDFRASSIFVYKDNDTASPRFYTKFDDRFMQTLQEMGWSRDNEVTVYMPIVVGVFD